MKHWLFATMITAALSPRAAAQDAGHWPHWRGPEATGVAPGPLATSWSDEENVRWIVPIEGRGVSTPVIWGERLFLTTAIPTEPEAEEAAAPAPDRTEREGEGGRRGGRGGGRRGMAPTEQSFETWCLDRTSGEVIWKQVARVATPHEGYHRSYGSFASPSPTTDGKRLYVSFGSQGTYAYDLNGELLWQAELGTELAMRNSFGEGHAPVLAGGALIQVCDQEGDSFAFALDPATGKELWRRERDEPSAWATPLVTTFEDRMQVVTAATNRVRSYDPMTGELLWECGGLGLNAIPAVLRWEDTVLAMSGYRESNIVAIQLGGEGDLTDSDAVAWTSPKGCAYTASPVIHDGLYYTVGDRGFISCFDALGGEPMYIEERLPQGSSLKSSPIAAGGLLYVPTEAGDVHLVRLGPELEFVATNSLTEQSFVASPAAADGDLYLRSMTHLICVSSDQEEDEG